MAKRQDTRLIMMVAQQPFETSDMNQFCKLIPMVYADGSIPDKADFPRDGEIWWMLTAQAARLANPGQLIMGTIENAVRYDEHDPDSSKFQVKRDSVQDLSLKDGIEVIELAGDAIDDIEDLVSGGMKLNLVTRPAPPVFLHWRAQFFGPFIANPAAHSATSGPQEFVLVPANAADMTIYRVDESKFNEATRGHRLALSDRVSFASDRRSRSYQLTQVKHDLVLPSGYDRVLATNPDKLVLEPLDRKLIQYAKECLSRQKRQELQSLLKELEIKGGEHESAEDLAAVIGRVRQVTEKQDAALDEVAKALLKAGLLGDDRLARAEQASAEKYIQDRTAELQAKAEAAIVLKRDEFRRIEAALKDLEARLHKAEAQSRVKLEQELAAERAKAREALGLERAEFEKQKAELSRQQNLLQTNLEKVTKELREAGDVVVNRFLTIAPFLGPLGLAHGQPARQDHPAAARPEVEEKAAAFEVPAYVAGTAATGDPLNEDAFFKRFCRVVEESGFTYRLLDLQRFHLSVKCGELTLLAGPSGTGKSTLPVLYARSLLGDEAGSGRTGCLMVNVNPSWMDARDLLGHMNTLESRFYPAESGLFQHLVIAQAEHQARGAATGIYLACLDEMNLSQVEHYFSDFMMVLERKGPARAIQCFSPEAAGQNCPFRRWGKVTLSPALRFVGTVNFDETTRLLSDRFLDRVNMIRIESAALPKIAGTDGALARATGRMVTLKDIEAWCTDSALPTELGSLLDQIRPQLGQIGCPVSPRVYRGICRVVGSAAPVMSPANAFDVQLAQRIIPKVRSLVTGRQLDALDKLLEILKQSNACTFEESMPLLEDIREAASMRGWNLEE